MRAISRTEKAAPKRKLPIFEWTTELTSIMTMTRVSIVVIKTIPRRGRLSISLLQPYTCIFIVPQRLRERPERRFSKI